MDADTLLRQIVEARESWVELAPGKRVRIRRPAEAEVPAFAAAKTTEEVVEAVARHVVGWEGVTQADLLGEAVGASDPAPFSRALWSAVSADRLAWLGSVQAGIIDALNAHHLSVAAVEKN